MELTLTTPTLLFSAIALLSLAYTNRHSSASSRVRAIKRDHDSGYKHPYISEQIGILVKRIRVIMFMHALDIVSLILASITMLLIYADQQQAGKLVFSASLLFFITSMLLSFYEITLSNKAILYEVEDLYQKKDS